MPNRFDELDELTTALELAIDDPDTIGTPEQFLAFIEQQARDIHTKTQELTVEDYNDAYEEGEGEDDNEESSS